MKVITRRPLGFESVDFVKQWFALFKFLDFNVKTLVHVHQYTSTQCSKNQ